MHKMKTMLCVAAVVGATALPVTAEAKVYDLEHHFYVPEFYEYMTSRTTPPRFIPGDPTSPDPVKRTGRFDIGQKTCYLMDDTQITNLTDFTETRIKAMDAAGVDVAVMSSSPLIETLPRDKAIELAKLSNDRLAAYQKKYPDRILGAATLPTIWVDDAVDELERCVKVLGFKYWHTQDHYVDHGSHTTNFLWEAKFAPLLEKANELGVAIYIHPDYQPQARYDYGSGYMGAMFGFGQGVMATATKFIIKGRLDEYPNIRLVLGHTGEYFPYVLERMDNRFFNTAMPDPEVKCQKKFSEYFKDGRIFVTTSGNRSEPALQCAKRAIGIERIAYASDWPYETMDSMTQFINAAKLTDAEREQLTEKTATERIFYKEVGADVPAARGAEDVAPYQQRTADRGAKRIDFEHHFVSTNYFNCVAQRTEPPMFDPETKVYTFGAVPAEWPLSQSAYSANSMYTDLTDLGDKRIAEMDRAGVDIAVISSSMQVDELPAADALRVAKASNDDLYQATKRHPDRFMGAALLPALQPDAACAELERCVKELGFKYWHTYSTIPGPDKKGHHIWEPEFEPILAKAAELGVSIYIHPEYSADADYWDAGAAYAGAGFGYGQDVMQTATHLVMNGTFDKYPTLRIILGHMGEYLPYVLDRMNYHMNVWSKVGGGFDPENVPCEETLYHYVLTNANFVITTSGAADTNAFQCAKEALGADRICFGSDWPYESFSEMVGNIDKCDLTDAERDGVWSDNAQMYVLHTTAKVQTKNLPSVSCASQSLRQRDTESDPWRAVPFNTVSNRYEAVSNAQVQVVYTIPAASELTFLDGSKEKTFDFQYKGSQGFTLPAIPPAELQTTGRKHYDLEHHCYIPEFYEVMRARGKVANPVVPYTDADDGVHVGIKTVIGIPPESLTCDFGAGRIAEMDKAGVDVAVLSSSSLIEALPLVDATNLAHQTNLRIAQMQEDYPGRVEGTATLPTFYPDEAVKELDFCVNKLGFKYWHTHSHYATNGVSHYLYEDMFTNLLARADSYGLSIYIHPDYPVKPTYDHGLAFVGAAMGFTHEVMQTMAHMIRRGRLDQYPNIKLVIGHFGEYFPYILDRLDKAFPAGGEGLNQKSFRQYVREGRIFVTTSGNRSVETMDATKEMIGIEHIAFGSDYPYEDLKGMTDYIGRCDLTESERTNVWEKTATERIFYKEVGADVPVARGAEDVAPYQQRTTAQVGADVPVARAAAEHIDASSHFISTNYLNCVAERTEKPTFKDGVLAFTSGQTLDLAKPCAGGLTFGEGLTNLAVRIAAMDAAGVDTAILSSFVQVWDLPEADAIRIARASNDDIAAAMRAYPGRFEGAALLPIVEGSATCVSAAIAELERCVNELGFKVWIASSNFGADHLYDKKFEPLLKRAEKLGVTIYLKDAYPIEEPFAALDGKDDPNEWGFALSNGQDLMVTATLMVMNGTFDRYPALRVVLPNLGEYLPFNLDRMSFMLANFEDPENVPCEETLFHYAVTNRNFILTTSGTTNEIPFTCAKRVMGAGALCFGTGWPFDDMGTQSDAIASFDLTDAERDGVWGINAQAYILAYKPTLKLGVVAQRYPWDGKVDAHYKATYWPVGQKGLIEITVGETSVTNEIDVVNGEGTAVIDMGELFGEKAEKARFRIVAE